MDEHIVNLHQKLNFLNDMSAKLNTQLSIHFPKYTTQNV